MKNSIELKLWGPRAMFSDPITRVGGERSSYPLPTYQALKGVLESIYWKPTIIWYIDSLRVIKPIKNESVNVKYIRFNNQNVHDLSIQTYLCDVEYQVRAHFEYNLNRPDLAGDRNDGKHHSMAVRSLEKGGRFDIFLGTRECQGYVEPCEFGSGTGTYDSAGTFNLGLMYHSLTYPEESGKNELMANFWHPKMKNGIVRFCRPEGCYVHKIVRDYKSKRINVSGGEGA